MSAEVVVEYDESPTEKPPELELSIEDETCEGTCKGPVVRGTPLAPRARVGKDTGACCPTEPPGNAALPADETLAAYNICGAFAFFDLNGFILSHPPKIVAEFYTGDA